GNRGIAPNNFCERAAVSLDAKRKGRDVEQQHGLDAVVKNAGLHSCAERHDFVRIQFDMRLAAEKFLHGAANQRSTRSAADKNDFIHVRGLELGVGKGLFDRAYGVGERGWDEGSE